jgi:outer membrane protein assembly factor BamD (BamD/ComL family)
MLRLFILSISFLVVSGCVTTKKKGDVSKLKKFYHNVTSEYNGYFNANELMVESERILRESNQDNYSKMLNVIDYGGVSDPKIVYPQLDKAIEKVTTVAALHVPGDWVDNCYVLMGKAQYMKQDFASSVETLEYFQSAFNPSNPYGRNYQKKRLKAGSAQANKERAKERQEKQKEVLDARKTKDKERADARKELDKQREQQTKEREAAAKARKSSSNSRGASSTSGTRGSSRSTKTSTPRTTRATNKPAQTTVKPEIKTENIDSTALSAQTSPEVAAAKPNEKSVEKPAQKPLALPKEYSDGTSYNEGLLYLAMAYTRMEKFSNAEYLLKRLTEIHGHTDEVKKGMPPAFADLMVRAGKYEEAIPYLEQAIKTTKRKELKGRYNFIIGQILQERGDFRNAAQYFARASKSSGRNFKMSFMADLYEIKNNAISGGRSASSVAGQLEKLLKQEKNKEYQDQIYFAMAEVEMSRNNEEKAKEYFSKSVAQNSANPTLKSEAYYQIAQMYLPNKKYDKAKLYIDSCLISLPELDERYPELSSLSQKLTTTAKFMQVVTEMDSVISLSKLSKEELRKIAIQRRKNNELASTTPTDAGKNSNLQNVSTRSLMGSSSFFAYNPLNVERGRNDFRAKWGTMTLQDNWRRSAKVNNEVAADNKETNDADQKRADSNQMDDEEFNQIMADVPMTEESLEIAKKKLHNALFEVGKSAKLDLDDSALSNQYLERLINEAPNHAQKLDILYLLYRNYFESNDMTNANRIKNLILSLYPDSNYAKIINDPNYAKALADKVVTLDKFYDITYQYFESKDYNTVLSRIEEGIINYGANNNYMPKFSLLKALSIGNTKGKEAYVDALQETIVRYPNAPETIKAKEIMRFLKGDEAAFNEVNVEQIEEEFTKDDNERHYVVVVLFDYTDEVLQKAKIAVNDYNNEYYRLQKLQIGEQALSKDENTQLLLVRSFDNFSKANDYYLGAYKDLEKFIPKTVAGYELYPISQKNFRKMITQRSHNKYRAFFESKY